jgi:hypothetical protein
VLVTPKHIERLPDNVVVMLTQDTSQYHDAKYMERDRKLLEGWSKKTDHLVKYDYYGLSWFTPRYYPHLAADDIKFTMDHGVVGQYNELYPFWANVSPMIYMGAQLLWNADQNPDDVLDEYFSGLYGDVAPQMKKFYSILEMQWMKKREGKWFEGIVDMNDQVGIFDQASMDDAMKCLETARDHSRGKVRRRVENIRDHFNWSYLMITGYRKAESLNTTALKTRDDANRSVSEMIEVLKIANQTKRVYESVIMNDPLYQHGSYSPDSGYFWYKFDQWESMLTDRVAERMARLTDWSQKNMNDGERETFISGSKDKLSQIELRKPVKL